MANVPPRLKYSKTHEWVKVDEDIATIGITDHAQAEMGDVVYLDLPEPGRILESDGRFGEIESVKAVSELFSPVSGEVVETNTGIQDTTDVVNTDPFGGGWLVRVRLSKPEELSQLMDSADYEKFIEEIGH